MRNAISSLFSLLSNVASTIVSVVFGAFRKMPVRVGLAIVGSICLTIAFVAGLMWGYIAPSLFSDNLQTTLQNSLSIILAMILVWISIATFIPSQERQSEGPQDSNESPNEIIEVRSQVLSQDEDDAELVE